MKSLYGDCVEVLREIPDDSVNLIVTSPPYAEQRKKTYDGKAVDGYVSWFIERAEEFKRVLAKDGTLIVNIKEHVKDCERSTYVLELILAMKKQGWLWTEEWCWHKKTAPPGKWPNRFRDSWERILQFNLDRKFHLTGMYQDEVMTPIGDWAKTRREHLSEADKTRQASATGSGFAKNVLKGVNREKVYPSNVLHLSPETGNKNHSAAFPEELPTFFIKLFSKPGDTILDPFQGSGTTGVAAVKLKRDYIGIDIKEEYAKLAEDRINKAVPVIPEAGLSSLMEK